MMLSFVGISIKKNLYLFEKGRILSSIWSFSYSYVN